MKNSYCDKDYWAVVADDNDTAWDIGRTKTEVIKSIAGPEPDYQKRWRRIKKWTTHPRIVRVTVTWAKPAPAKETP